MIGSSLLRRRWWLALSGGLLLACASASAGVAGDPLLQRFTPADFKATPYLFSLAIDPEGRVYVGNNDGLLRMQGREWQTLELPGGMAANLLQRGTDQRIYVAGYDSFGYVETGVDGRMVYHDLRDAFGLKGNDRALGWFYEIMPVSDGVYFYAQNHLLFYAFHGRNRHWPIAEGSIQAGFSTWRDRLYTQNLERGLLRFDDGRLVPVPGGQAMTRHTGATLIDQGDSALVVTNGGFFRLRDDGIVALDVPPLPVSPFSLLQVLPDRGFVVTTTTGQLLHYDAQAHLIASMPIARSNVTGMDVDREGALWATTEDELIRLQVASPWSRLDVGNLGGVVIDCEWYAGSLWLSVGSRGLVRLDVSSGQVQPTWIEGETKRQILGLTATDSGLLVGHDSGIDQVAADGTIATLVKDPLQGSVFSIELSKHDPDLAYAAGQAGVYLLRRQQGHWALLKLLPAPELDSQLVEEVGPGVLWVNNAHGLPERWTVDPVAGRLLKRETFPIRPGAKNVDLDHGTELTVFSNTVYVQVGRQALRFDGRQFVPFDGPPFTFMQRPNSFVVIDSPVGAFAYTGSLLYHQQRDGGWRQVEFGSEPSASQSVLRYGADGVLRLSIWRSLLQYQPDHDASPPPPPLQARLTAVTRVEAQGRRQVLPLRTHEPPEFQQGESLELRFEVFSAEPGVEYRSRIPGLIENFDSWSETPTLTLSGLEHPGTYRVEVQARAPSGRPIEPVFYTFTILPRWYQRTVVRLLFVLGMLVVLRSLQRWREKRREQVYLDRQKELEQKIAERTEALAEANRKLEELATEDGLTGVANRRALELGLQREWQRCLDTRTSIAILMIDVDRFKQYNDRHGHQAGDEVLKEVADRLSVGLEPQRELLARYGGEEFSLLLSSTVGSEAWNSRDLKSRPH